MSTPEVSDLGEQFETPDEALTDAEKTIRELKEEHNRLRLCLTEAELQRNRLDDQVVDAVRRLDAFKHAVRTVMTELARD